METVKLHQTTCWFCCETQGEVEAEFEDSIKVVLGAVFGELLASFMRIFERKIIFNVSSPLTNPSCQIDFTSAEACKLSYLSNKSCYNLRASVALCEYLNTWIDNKKSRNRSETSVTGNWNNKPQRLQYWGLFARWEWHFKNNEKSLLLSSGRVVKAVLSTRCIDHVWATWKYLKSTKNLFECDLNEQKLASRGPWALERTLRFPGTSAAPSALDAWRKSK